MPAFTRSQHRRFKAMIQRQTRRSAKQSQITSAHFAGTSLQVSSLPSSADSFDLSSLKSAFQETTSTPRKKITSKRKKTSDDASTAVPLLDKLSLKSPSKKTPSFLPLESTRPPLQDSSVTNKTMAGSTAEASSKSDEPPVKKKRTADRQITKDDGLENSDGADENSNHDGSFVKADDEVLKKRRIVRARRPARDATTTTTTTSDDNEEKSSSNPFANAILTASNDTSKVFGSGSGFTGFGAAAAATSSGFGTAISSGGFGGGTAYKGFGTAPSTGFGFGMAATATDGSAGSPGTPSGLKTINLFDTTKLGTVPTFSFGLSTNTTAKADKTDSAPSSPTKPLVNLPVEVKLTTGEENEKTLMEVRVKSFKLVEKLDNETKEGRTQEANTATPSVPPSSSSFAKPKETGPDADATEGKATADSKSESKTEADADEKKSGMSWQERGVGLLRVLEGGPNKYRLVQRYQGKNTGDRPTKVLINVPFWKESSVIKPDTKYLQLDLLVPTEAKKLEKQTYSLKFESEKEANDLFNILMEKKKDAKSLDSLGDEGKTEEAKAD